MTEASSAVMAWLDRRCEQSAHRFVEMHRPMVRRVVQQWLPTAPMIDDVVQETFIKAFKAMHRLLPGSNIAGWLVSIARNTSANYLRGWQRNIVRPATDYEMDDLSEMLITRDAPVDEDADTERAIEALLSHLQQQDRQMLTLFHFENRSARDVGERLGLTEGNVRVRLMRSHRALRDHALTMRANGQL